MRIGSETGRALGRAPDARPDAAPDAAPGLSEGPLATRRRRRVTAALFALVFATGAGLGLAALSTLMGGSPAIAQNGADSGRSIPRMVSLAADEVNVRTGPGIRFPVKWVFKREGMPLRVVAEYDAWRKIRDWEGAEGWVHRAMLSARPTVLVIRPEVTIRRAPDAGAPAVARLAAGMVARLDGCEGGWCRLEVRGYDGWVPRDGLWGLDPTD